MDIKKKAVFPVKSYNAGNPFEIAGYLNLILIVTFLEGKTRGFYQYFQRNDLIYIDGQLPEWEQKWVLAHELGHLFLHKKTNVLFLDTRTNLKTQKYELNIFAAELLIPDSLILTNPGFSKKQLAELAGYKELRMDYKRL